ncbi:F-box domain-containing protein [Favolaschia claudopus]|uniref:F-box domain-containing protein n=1 Tax=Favolaschia claudopus TaxID=2862362 RepID=A0AAW0AXQ4_9AGAR
MSVESDSIQLDITSERNSSSPEILGFPANSLSDPISAPPCTTSVHSLPTEIIAEIFEKFVPDYPECRPHTATSSPNSLTQICGRWRQIALSMPYLWRAIGIEIEDDDSDCSMAQKLEVLETWLLRSGVCPLSIRLHYTSTRLIHDLFPPFMHAIVRHCHRWEYLDLIMPHGSLHLIEGKMPLLKKVEIGPSFLTDGDEPSISLFSDAPLLTRAVLGLHFLLQTTHLPWARLQHLTGLRLYDYECLQILRYAPDLISFAVVELAELELVHSGGLEEITHTRLRSMVLCVSGEEWTADLETLMDLLTLPALQTLELSETDFFADDDLREPVKALLSRSGCVLDSLRIHGAKSSKNAYHNALGPLVKTVTICSSL